MYAWLRKIGHTDVFKNNSIVIFPYLEHVNYLYKFLLSAKQIPTETVTITAASDNTYILARLKTFDQST